MKKLATLFSCLGFIVQYIVPIALFGNVIPYTHEGLAAGLTGAAYIAVGLILFFLTKKFKEWIFQRPKSLWRGLILSLPAIIWWLVIYLALGWISTFVIEFSQYWGSIILFIILGRGLYVLSESMHNIASDKEESE